MIDDPNVPTAVDLFAGAGGLAEGMLRSGVDVVASVELHPQPALTHAFNHPRTHVLVGDIRELNLDVLDAAIKSRIGSRGIDVVIGGPPCQGFSSAGKKAETDPRNSLFRHYVRVVNHLRPRIFLMENVPGFKSMYGGAVYDEAVQAMHELGYETSWNIVHAKSLGVPQTRRRFVLAGWLPGTAAPFQWPEASHGHDTQDDLFGQLRVPLVTAGEALEDLSFVEPGFEATQYKDVPASSFALERRSGNSFLFNHLATRHRDKARGIIERIPVGGSIRDLPMEERGTRKLTMSKIHPHEVSNTVVSLPDDMLHYAQPRILSVREAARLQTFDDDFVFFGKRTSGFVERRVDVPQYTQVGNAVPPVLAAALGRAVLRSLGARTADLRDIEWRRQRQRLVCGSSGYAGYELTSEAVGEVELTTVHGRTLELPISTSAVPVMEQAPLCEWVKSLNPRRGQWAPGVIPKAHPSWMDVNQLAMPDLVG